MFYPRWLAHFFSGVAVTSFPRKADPEAPARAVKIEMAQPLFRRSLTVAHVDGGSCNAPESELGLLGSPVYDFSRLGFRFSSSPRHADILLVTGVVVKTMVPYIQATYRAMPEPKLVLAVGDCPVGSCVFKDAPGTVNLRDILPLAGVISGCPPSPNDILAGLMAAVGLPDGAVT